MERQEGDRPENMDIGDETSTLPPEEQQVSEEMNIDNSESETNQETSVPLDIVEDDITDEDETQETARCGSMQYISDVEVIDLEEVQTHLTFATPPFTHINPRYCSKALRIVRFQRGL